MYGIIFYLSILLGVFSLCAVLPAFVGWGYGETGFAFDFLMLSALGFFISAVVVQAIKGGDRHLSRYQSFILCLVVWLVLPFFGALPFAVIGDYPFMDAVFEATSGLTTSGATLSTNIDALSRSLVFWRSELQWLGGLLALVTILFVLAPSGLGGLPSRHIRLVDPKSNEQGKVHVAHVLRQIIAGYCLISILCAVALYFAGLDAFDAVCLTMATVSTGGFMPRDGSVDQYQNLAVMFILTLFMLTGATSLLWHRMILSRRVQLMLEHRESYLVVLIGLGLGLMFAITFFKLAGSALVLHPAIALIEGVFTGISVVTSTGFDARTAGMTVLPLPLILMISFIGGTTFSASGGVKLYRIGGMLVQSLREMERLVHPHSIRPSKFGSQPYDIQLMKAIWTGFCLFILVIVATAFSLSLFEDLPLSASLTAAISNVSLIGQIYSSGWLQAADWPGYANFSAMGKASLSLAMIIGRLDVVVLFGILSQIDLFRN